MEALLNQQAVAIDNLNRITINFSKDSKSRKNIDYFRKKIQELEEWRREFVFRHNKLQPFEAMSDQPYFTEKKYEQASEMHVLHLNVLQTGLDRIMAITSQPFQSSILTPENPQPAARQNIESTRINDLGDNNTGDVELIDVDLDDATIALIKTLQIRESEIKGIINVIYKLNDSMSNGYAKTQLEMLKTA